MTLSTQAMVARCSHQGLVKGIQFMGLRRLFTTDCAAAQHLPKTSPNSEYHCLPDCRPLYRGLLAVSHKAHLQRGCLLPILLSKGCEISVAG